jgi:hypothetical protein
VPATIVPCRTVLESRCPAPQSPARRATPGPQRSGPANRPPSANRAGVRPACCLALYLEACWKGITSGSLRCTIARRSPTVLAARRGSCAWLALTVSDGGPSISDLRGVEQEVGRGGGVSTPRCERAPGGGEIPEPYRLSARSLVRADSVPRRGFVTGAARWGGGEPLRGHQRAIAAPFVPTPCGAKAARRPDVATPRSFGRSFGPSAFRHRRLS